MRAWRRMKDWLDCGTGMVVILGVFEFFIY